jgi:hypothetical protein
MVSGRSRYELLSVSCRNGSILRHMSRFRSFCLLLLVVVGIGGGAAGAQPVTIARVEAMPALPPTYRLLDWKRLALAYDSLVFDPARTGPHLPLVWINGSGVNYPAHPSFGLVSYVGHNARSGEAINTLPALVGATLAGANKRAQYGHDWVLYAEEWFNRVGGEGVYLNNPQARSGGDGWYDTMPNVFFYQLAALYPGVGSFDAQFRSVADRWLQAVQALGGRTTPYAVPDFNIRGIDLRTLTPNRTGVHEPEMAGAVAWLLYMAYVRTGDDRYRVGAEQALDFLEARTANPSYELQLPYGALAAARMNAELGTHYSVPKLVNWSFERGPLRGWGTYAGTRGGLDVSGLVGEVDGDGYFFTLNGVQQAAALVPLVRYDDRFARAIGRWMVNLASANRLFYSTQLPPANQDSYAWASAHDPRGTIAYEALRGRQGTLAPFATGDAIRGGWAATNLALYGSSSVGYLGALVDSTEVPGLLRLDLLKTDFYRRDAYPSYLYYNPHPTEKTVTLRLNFGTYDLYDAAADAFVARGVRGVAAVAIPPDAARVIVVTPAGGDEGRSEGRLRIGGVVVDYRVASGNRTPRVKSLAATNPVPTRNEPTTLHCIGDDPDAEPVSVAWHASGGTLTPSGATATFSAAEAGTYSVTCTVRDAAGAEGAQSLAIRVVANRAPVLTTVRAAPAAVDPRSTTTLTCEATDPDGDPITYVWSVPAGAISGSGASVVFTAPETVGVVPAVCLVRDPSGAEARDTAFVTVGRLVLDLPLDGGAALDQSGFGHGGTLAGPVATEGRTGLPGTALTFDGMDDVVTVAAAGRRALAMTEAVTVSAWVRPAAGVPARERFVVSHGSYQHRYKLSLLASTSPGAVTPRWTIRTGAGVADLDATRPLTVGVFSHLVATYDGAAMRLFVNGAPAGERAFTGVLATTDLPLLLGQMLPADSGYNFAGVLDDVRLYNRALTPAEVQGLYTTAEIDLRAVPFKVGAPSPNPARGPVVFTVTLAAPAPVVVAVHDVLGRRVATLHEGMLGAGPTAFTWTGAGAGAGLYLLHVVAGGRTAQRSVVLVR